jgi:zinc D-Ala-D-Ala carboxypeptidase
MNLKYFDISEFDSPDQKGSGSNMDATLLDMLDSLREHFGKPIRISSGYRTQSHNKKVGGVDGSSHLYGYAVDIVCSASRDRHRILQLAMDIGFNRIGIANSFIHLDNDPKKPENCVWTY